MSVWGKLQVFCGEISNWAPTKSGRKIGCKKSTQTRFSNLISRC